MQQPAPRDCPAPLTVHRACRQLSLLVWEGAASPNPRRLRVLVDGTAARPPLTHVSLAMERGGQRHILALGLSVPASVSPALEIVELGGRIVAVSRCQATLRVHGYEFDALALVDGLAGAERARLARFLLEVCSSLFRVAADPTFVANARILLLEIAAGSSRLVARCALPGGHVLCESLVPAALGEQLSGLVVDAGAVTRLATPPRLLALLAKQPDLARLAVVLRRPSASRSALIVIFGNKGLVCRRLAEAPRQLPNAHEYFAAAGESGAPLRSHLLDCLATPDFAEGQGASLLRELRLLPSGLCKSQDAHAAVLGAAAELVVGCDDGLFVSGRLTDPHRLTEAVLIERDGVTRSVSTDELTSFRPRESGACTGRTGFAFFAHERDGRSSFAPVRISLGLRSGARIEIGEGPALLAPEWASKAILDSVPRDQVHNEALLAVIERPLAALNAQRSGKPVCSQAHDVGAPPANPAASIIVPFVADLELLRCRLSAFALDPAMANVEVIHLVESAENFEAAQRMLVDLRSGYGLASRILVPDRQLPLGALLNLGARAARAPFLALLGPTAVPENSGWLETLISFLRARPQRGIVGGKLLYGDQSLIAAGCAIGTDDFGRWALRPQLSGFPRDFRAASGPRRVAALSADCLVICRSLLEQTQGFAEDYFSADAVCADLCFRVGALRRDVCWLPNPALFRLNLRTSAAAEHRSALHAELDRRTLERRWRQSLETERAERAGTISRLRVGGAGETAAPLRRVA